MKILGASWLHASSAAVSVSHKRVQLGLLESSFTRESQDSSFPTNALRAVAGVDDIEYVATPVNAHLQEFSKRAALYTKNIIPVDYIDALAMTPISLTTWDTCAVVVLDKHVFALGVYENNTLHWFHEQREAVTPGMFIHIACEFLGIAPSSFVNYAQSGSPVFAPWILNNLVSVEPPQFIAENALLSNYGVAAADANIAASVHSAYTQSVVSLVQWLSQQTFYSRLAIAGSLANDYITNRQILEHTDFEELAVQPSAESICIGAASAVDRVLWEHCYIGHPAKDIYYKEILQTLLLGQVFENCNPTTEFRDSSFICNNRLVLPFAQNNLDSVTAVICQEQDYDNYYKSIKFKKSTEYIESIPLPNNPLPYSRVVTVSSNRNPTIYKVLSHLKEHGHPFILSGPLRNNNEF